MPFSYGFPTMYSVRSHRFPDIFMVHAELLHHNGRCPKEQVSSQSHAHSVTTSAGDLCTRWPPSDGRSRRRLQKSNRRDYRLTRAAFAAIIADKDLQRVSIQDGEQYRQACLDEGNRPATAVKKLKEIRCLLQTAVKRRQLDENPLAHIQMPRYSPKEVHIFSNAECDRIIKAAKEFVNHRRGRPVIRWDLLVLMGLCTAMRRGEANCSTARGQRSIWRPRRSPSLPRRIQRRRGRGRSQIAIDGRCR